MNFIQKYKIARQIRNTKAAPTLTHEIASETYNLGTQEYNITAIIYLPHYDGEKTSYNLTIADKQTTKLYTASDTFFAKMIIKMLERKYYNTGHVK